jgi:dolichyl-phosphate beta-glucosyltransferase
MENNQNSIYLSLVIPFFNEERRIRKTLDNALDFFHNTGYQFEIILIDDGSRDRSFEIVRKYKDLHNNMVVLKNEKNSGKGYTVKRGMLRAQGEYIFFLDADFPIFFNEMDKLLNFLKQGCKIVISSRALPESKILIPQPFYRRLAGRIFHFFSEFIIPTKVSDTQCGFKAFSKQAAKEIFSLQRLSRFCFDVEILHIAKKLGYRIKEVPIVWAHSKSNNKIAFFKNGLLMLMDLIVIRIWDRLGYYNRN